MMPETPDRLAIPVPIPETSLVPCARTLRARLSVMLQRPRARAAHKIGGEPDWIQGDETPQCCGQSALFYGQLASLGGKYDLIDNGIIYVFICRACLQTHSVFQFS
jgi:hypothetical protein